MLFDSSLSPLGRRDGEEGRSWGADTQAFFPTPFQRERESETNYEVCRSSGGRWEKNYVR
jgi:hypothetical protein